MLENGPNAITREVQSQKPWELGCFKKKAVSIDRKGELPRHFFIRPEETSNFPKLAQN
jgi:hypothetical protein